ncbi:RidA family protein [Solimicrobium silvestre]|uniref:Putative translation initiation inhibitor yjgF family n=1 Tax=Solimicrobium silvestre TaxID=2099400 RepID=A0A2S9H038_9BURK|nr:RidA family protein [Solimicrobium silvestre]PRC93341.1 putative translation initiation inhibitor yjgF family [Solimicrobium silvestre]
MSKKLISSGSDFEKLAGYSRAVVEHGLVHVSGTTGFNYDAMTIDADLIDQTHQIFKNIEAALKQAGAGLDDVVRVHYLITDASYFEQVAPIFGQYFVNARPAATAMVVGLIDPRMKIEIEVTARLPNLN